MHSLKRCIYCEHDHLYLLDDGRVKCSRCKKKYSLKRVKKVLSIMDSFTHDETARQASKHLGLSYVSVHRYFDLFRQYSAKISEDEYESLRHITCEYEEYYYLERAKRHRPEAVFDAHNFLTFDYDGHIYNILMPTLQRYRDQFIDDDLVEVYSSEFNRFKRKSRIIKVTKHLNKIVAFWDYFEASIVRYKGVSSENFPLYLKEIEFKFNHAPDSQQTLLECYYFRNP